MAKFPLRLEKTTDRPYSRNGHLDKEKDILFKDVNFSLKIKKPAAPYSRTGESRTTLGEGALNFRVRNGNGCDNSSMATGKKPKLES